MPSRRLTLFSKCDETISSFQITFFMQAIFEMLYQEQGVFGLHCATLVKNDKAILFTQDQKNRFCCVSGNRVTILRDDYFLRNYPRSSKSIMGRLGSERSYVCPENVGISRTSSPSSVSKIFLFRFSSNNFSGRISEFDSFLRVFRGFSECIRSTNATLMNLKYSLLSLDKRDLSKRKMIFSKEFARKTPFYSLRGGLDYISSKLVDLVG